MTEKLTLDAVARLLAEELTKACGARLGGDATAAPSEAPAAEGWTFTVLAAGTVAGRLTVWTDRDSAAACARATLATDATPSDAQVVEVWHALLGEATTALQARPDCAGVNFGAADIGSGPAPAGARTYYVAAPNVASCVIAVGVERAAVSARAAEERLGAVLGVDLPLVVRFGRTSLPMRAVSELGPGSVIDMARSPDEPVDVLVGDRLIARGEVVVVGGNYGVRITALAGQDASGS